MKARHQVLVRSHPDVLLHLPPLGHPEAPARVRAVLGGLHGGGSWAVEDEAVLPPEDDTLGVVRWLHDPGLVDRLRRASEAGRGFVDVPDNPVSEGTYRAAVAAAGLAVATALDLVNGRLLRAFLALRPPGHHAEADRAMGYCFFNNVALAAEVVTRALQAPVLVVDFDVHHGNGTQRLFWERADVAYFSVHRYPFYPGTGAGDELGEGAGRGFTRNVPLAAGADDEVYAAAVEGGLEDLGRALKPAAILVSAGFDAHRRDPLGGMAVTEEGFRRIARAIVQAANTWSGGRIIACLEGGYDLDALASCAGVFTAELAHDV